MALLHDRFTPEDTLRTLTEDRYCEELSPLHRFSWIWWHAALEVALCTENRLAGGLWVSIMEQIMEACDQHDLARIDILTQMAREELTRKKLIR